MDGTTIGAILGFFGLVVTTIGGVYIATRTNKAEKESTALKALEETRDEAYEARLALFEQQVAFLQLDAERVAKQHEEAWKRQSDLFEEDRNKYERECKLRIEELESENDELWLRIRRLREFDQDQKEV